jgi:hypothetical protein
MHCYFFFCVSNIIKFEISKKLSDSALLPLCTPVSCIKGKNFLLILLFIYHSEIMYFVYVLCTVCMKWMHVGLIMSHCPHDSAKPLDRCCWKLVWMLCHWDLYNCTFQFPITGNTNGRHWTQMIHRWKLKLFFENYFS